MEIKKVILKDVDGSPKHLDVDGNTKFRLPKFSSFGEGVEALIDGKVMFYPIINIFRIDYID